MGNLVSSEPWLVPSFEQLISVDVYGEGENARVYRILNLRSRKMVARKVVARCNPQALQKEAAMQRRVAALGMAPAVVAVNPRRCTIDMQPVDRSLLQIATRGEPRLPAGVAEQLVGLIEGLVDAGIKHPDLHYKNVCEMGGRLVAIDFDGVAHASFTQREAMKEKADLLNAILYAKEIEAGGKIVQPAGLVRGGYVADEECFRDALARWDGVPLGGKRARVATEKAAAAAAARKARKRA